MFLVLLPWREYVPFPPFNGLTDVLIQKYLLPHLRPPAATAYEMDRDALTAQFDAVEAMLKEMQADTAAVREAVEEQQRKVEQTTEEVSAAVAEMREGEVKARDELREIREEVNNIREMLPKVCSVFVTLVLLLTLLDSYR